MESDLIAENCRDLLLAIYNSDNNDIYFKKITDVICVYDISNYEKLVGIFNDYSSCANFLGTTSRCVQTYRCKNKIYKKKYVIERFSLTERFDKDDNNWI